jgi:hypothetical protein
VMCTVAMAVFGEQVNNAAIRRAWYELRQACTSTEVAAERVSI